MVASLLAWWIQRTIRRMEFPGQTPNGRSISDPVLQNFSRGCTLGLKGVPDALFQREARSLPWNLRAFFHEGHAMGAAGRSACSLRKPNPEQAPQSDDYRVMRFVGYGFWNGAAKIYPIPSLSEDHEYWKGIDSYGKHRLLMANGVGFSTVLFAKKFDREVKRRFLSQPDAQCREAAFHGVGRVLWFLYLNNFKALRKVLSEHADVAEPLGIGMGLAIAFTQVATPDKILQAIDQFEPSDRLNLIRGAGIALQVHASNDPECKVHVERLLKGDLRDWYDGAWQASLDAGEGTDWYPQYHELTHRFAGPVAASRG